MPWDSIPRTFDFLILKLPGKGGAGQGDDDTETFADIGGTADNLQVLVADCNLAEGQFIGIRVALAG